MNIHKIQLDYSYYKRQTITFFTWSSPFKGWPRIGQEAEKHLIPLALVKVTNRFNSSYARSQLFQKPLSFSYFLKIMLKILRCSEDPGGHSLVSSNVMTTSGCSVPSLLGRRWTTCLVTCMRQSTYASMHKKHLSFFFK